jgi:hypothetical protein
MEKFSALSARLQNCKDSLDKRECLHSDSGANALQSQTTDPGMGTVVLLFTIIDTIAPVML